MPGKIVINADDFRRLKVVIRKARHTRPRGTYVNALERELRRADLLLPPHVPADAVTMNSTVRLRDVDDDERCVVTVAYPHHLAGDGQAVSVLAPLGTAILGARVGDVVRVHMARGVRSLEVERILYQPEAAGDLHL